MTRIHSSLEVYLSYTCCGACGASWGEMRRREAGKSGPKRYLALRISADLVNTDAHHHC